MVNKTVQNILKYNAVFEPCDEGGFTVSFPKLPGIVTEGDTFEEATEMAKDALIGHLQVLRDGGVEIPEPDERTFVAPISISFSYGQPAIA